MTRDWDLIRGLLVEIEAKCDGGMPVNQNRLEVGPADAAAVGYHLALLHEASLIRATEVSNNDSAYPEFLIDRLTAEGHDFLDAARRENLWEKAKRGAGDLGLEALKRVLFRLATEAADAAIS